MKNISKKGIMGMALLASLSVFAGTTTLKENKNKIPVQNEQCPEPPKDANGNPIKPDETKMKAEFEQRAKRIEELKTKLKTGNLTSSESEEIIEILSRKGRPHKDCKPPKDEKKPERKFDKEPPKDANGNPIKLDETKMKAEFEKREKRVEELKTKLKTGKLTANEREELIEILDRIGKRGPRRPEGNPPQIENQK
nr:MAG TPA: hypothetical protein [Caudoviricetes sp.]